MGVPDASFEFFSTQKLATIREKYAKLLRHERTLFRVSSKVKNRLYEI